MEEYASKCCHVSYERITRYFTPGGPQRSPSPTRSHVKEGSAEINKELNLTTASHIMCSRLCPSTPYFQVSSYSDMVLGPLQKLLSVCAFVRAGGNLVASYDPPKLNARTIKNVTGEHPEKESNPSSSSGSGGHAGGNSNAQVDVLKSWVLGITSMLKTLADVSAKQSWRILATNQEHSTLAESASTASNIWKQFDNSANWTHPNTSKLIEGTLDVISAGGNLPAEGWNEVISLTLPPFVRMQDLKPADGKEVFILTDSVKIQGKEGKYDTVNFEYIHKQILPLLSAHFGKVTIISVNGWKQKDILAEITDLVQSKAGGDPGAFDHVLVLMPSLFRQDELTEIGGGMIKKQQLEPVAFNRLPGHPEANWDFSSPTELPVPTEVCEASPTSPAEENMTKRQKLEPVARRPGSFFSYRAPDPNRGMRSHLSCQRGKYRR